MDRIYIIFNLTFMKKLLIQFSNNLLNSAELSQIRGGDGYAPSICKVNCSVANGGGSITLSCSGECEVRGECVRCLPNGSEQCCTLG